MFRKFKMINEKYFYKFSENFGKKETIEIILKNLEIFGENYLLNFAQDIYFGLRGENIFSKKRVLQNKKLENEIGKGFLACSILQGDLEKYLISKKFLKKGYDIYQPIKINFLSKVEIEETSLTFIQGEIIIKPKRRILNFFLSIEEKLFQGKKSKNGN